MPFCGEISYSTPAGNVHSDICHGCNPNQPDVPPLDEYRKFLHQALDEWLDKSNGTGGFWVGDPAHFVGWGS